MQGRVGDSLAGIQLCMHKWIISFYSRKGYWKWIAAIRKLPLAANASQNVASAWLQKQAIWQTYLPASLHVLRPKWYLYDHISVPNEADLLFLPRDKVRRSTYKYALTIVDVTSLYKEAEPLTSKYFTEVASDLSRIYSRGPLKWLTILHRPLNLYSSRRQRARCACVISDTRPGGGIQTTRSVSKWAFVVQEAAALSV